MLRFCVIAAFCFFGGALAQVMSFGRCPKIETVKSFSFLQGKGKWFQAYKYDNIHLNVPTCMSAYVSPSSASKGVVTITNKNNNHEKSTNVTFQVTDTRKPGRVENIGDKKLLHSKEYLILATDYRSYALVYNCKDMLVSRFENAWIITRAKNPSEAVINKALQTAKNFGLKVKSFKKAEQMICS